jgi:hypothetical protein
VNLEAIAKALSDTRPMPIRRMPPAEQRRFEEARRQWEIDVAAVGRAVGVTNPDEWMELCR